MSVTLRPRDSRQDHQQAAICLLRLITARPADLTTLLIESEEATTEKASSDDAEDDTGDLEDTEISSTDDEERRDLKSLRDKVLDRLAETLARYKSDPKESKGSNLDPKHVSSTMMIMHDDEKKVKILCAKNGGLDQGNSTSDTDFLNSWKTCMEPISRSGTATEEDHAHMFDLVLNYQQPRINYYVERLRHALRFQEPRKHLDFGKQAVLSDIWLQKLPNPGTRVWIDDRGNDFKFVVHSSDEADNNSNVTLSAHSIGHFERDVETILRVIDKLSALDGKVRNDTRQTTLLKELLPSLFAAWRSARFQASMKAQLHIRFQQSQNPQKRRNEVMTALKLLCRCYHSVVTFVRAAESMPIFQNIECIPVSVPPKASKPKRAKTARAKETPVEVTKSLGLLLRGSGWIGHLESQPTKAAFKKLRGETCHVHAEIQILFYQNSFTMSSGKQGKVHPYVGCSKLCCLLCWLFIQIHGEFSVRGCHETIVHRWEVPKRSPAEITTSKYQSVSDTLLDIIKLLLQKVFDQGFPLEHPKLLAQSSAALSTTQTVLDREKAEMEKSQLQMRQRMMGRVVMDDGLLVLENLQKPGFVSVIGGSLTKVKEMTCQEAEIYQGNHIRGKFGLELLDQMPPNQSTAGKPTCRRCGSTSSLRCSACRTKYCSKSCQKRDWRWHVFTCTIKNRPNDVDHFKLIRIRWSRAAGKESSQAQVLLDLYSSEDLCKTFGFNHCHDASEVSSLFCLYGHLISKVGTNNLQFAVDAGRLGDTLEAVAEVARFDRKNSFCDCPCFAWFLDRRSTGYGFIFPYEEASYVYQIKGLRQAEHFLSLEERNDEVDPLSGTEKKILSLYSMLFRDFNNIPGPLSSKWLEFGFCFCANHDQRMKLAKVYIQLVKSGAYIKDIARAFESQSISALMKSRDIDISFFETNGILFHRPDIDERGIYRFIAEVNHTLSGRFCHCFLAKSYCHPKFETRLSHESDGDYGFHGTNAWERWQLFNFYKYVFSRPDFNARKMQDAKRNSDPERLGQYLEELVPDYQKKLLNRVLGDALFPKIKNRIRFPNGRPDCFCVMHDTIDPEGLDWGTRLNTSHFSELVPEVEEE